MVGATLIGMFGNDGGKYPQICTDVVDAYQAPAAAVVRGTGASGQRYGATAFRKLRQHGPRIARHLSAPPHSPWCLLTVQQEAPLHEQACWHARWPASANRKPPKIVVRHELDLPARVASRMRALFVQYVRLFRFLRDAAIASKFRPSFGDRIDHRLYSNCEVNPVQCGHCNGISIRSRVVCVCVSVSVDGPARLRGSDGFTATGAI